MASSIEVTNSRTLQTYDLKVKALWNKNRLFIRSVYATFEADFVKVAIK